MDYQSRGDCLDLRRQLTKPLNAAFTITTRPWVIAVLRTSTSSTTPASHFTTGAVYTLPGTLMSPSPTLETLDEAVELRGAPPLVDSPHLLLRVDGGDVTPDLVHNPAGSSSVRPAHTLGNRRAPELDDREPSPSPSKKALGKRRAVEFTAPTTPRGFSDRELHPLRSIAASTGATAAAQSPMSNLSVQRPTSTAFTTTSRFYDPLTPPLPSVDNAPLPGKALPVALHESRINEPGNGHSFMTLLVFRKLMRPRTVNVPLTIASKDLSIVFDNDPREDGDGTLSTYSLNRWFELAAVGDLETMESAYGNSSGPRPNTRRAQPAIHESTRYPALRISTVPQIPIHLRVHDYRDISHPSRYLPPLCAAHHLTFGLIVAACFCVPSCSE
ncbi:hypothetical protein B0H13DRAFT_1867090 [Mycena leptocephala]|nr:hypothetical protein B0H13DRAFT_1867090 [Mycena leptocephala]